MTYAAVPAFLLYLFCCISSSSHVLDSVKSVLIVGADLEKGGLFAAASGACFPPRLGCVSDALACLSGEGG